MAGDDLPIYPTPYELSNASHTNQHRQPPPAKHQQPHGYRPPVKQQSHQLQQSYRTASQQQQQQNMYLSSAQQPQAPIPQQHAHQQQYYQQAPAPLPQQYTYQQAQVQQQSPPPQQLQYYPQPEYRPQQLQHQPQQYQQHQQQLQQHQAPLQTQSQTRPPPPPLQAPHKSRQSSQGQAPSQYSIPAQQSAQGQVPSQYASIPTLQSSSSSKKNSKTHEVEYPNAQLSAKQKLENELRSVFEKVDSNHSGKISSRELSTALLNFDHTRFQDSTVILMMNLFTSTDSPLKTLNFDQFVSLWKYLSAYKKLFIAADTDKLGDISFGEFQKILEQIGYKLNIDLVLHLFQKFSAKAPSGFDSPAMAVGKLKFDSFIELLVTLRRFTDVFKKYDKDVTGIATIKFLDFLFEIVNLT